MPLYLDSCATLSPKASKHSTLTSYVEKLFKNMRNVPESEFIKLHMLYFTLISSSILDELSSSRDGNVSGSLPFR
jgi:hypothetical protein